MFSRVQVCNNIVIAAKLCRLMTSFSNSGGQYNLALLFEKLVIYLYDNCAATISVFYLHCCMSDPMGVGWKTLYGCA